MELTSEEQFDHLKGALEALLFVSEKPVTLEQLKTTMPSVGKADVKKAINLLITDYEARQSGLTIKEIAGGYQMLSNPRYAEYIKILYRSRHKEKLSKPALETLAIVAYKQPVTRADVELIRGVNSDGVMASLLSKELIKVAGRKDIPGKPFLFGTTKQFLEYFGLKSLDQLPKLEEFPMLEPASGDDDSSSLLESGEEQSEVVRAEEVNENDTETSPDDDSGSREEGTNNFENNEDGHYERGSLKEDSLPEEDSRVEEMKTGGEASEENQNSDEASAPVTVNSAGEEIEENDERHQ